MGGGHPIKTRPHPLEGYHLGKSHQKQHPQTGLQTSNRQSEQSSHLEPSVLGYWRWFREAESVLCWPGEGVVTKNLPKPSPLLLGQQEPALPNQGGRGDLARAGSIALHEYA